MYSVTINRARPDFRCFIDLLYGTDKAVDSDGDAHPVNDRSWSYLYLCARESPRSPIEIWAGEEDISQFSVSSESSQLEELAALYLYLTCGESISRADQKLDQSTIDDLCERYSVRLKRARESIWHQETDAFPYPNR